MNKIRRFLRVSCLWVLLAPWASLGLGIASNEAVLISNHDRFPVMMNPVKLDDLRGIQGQTTLPADMLDDVHCVMTKDTHLNSLADVFDFKDGIYSIGDGLTELGQWANEFCVIAWLTLIFKKVWDGEIQ